MPFEEDQLAKHERDIGLNRDLANTVLLMHRNLLASLEMKYEAPETQNSMVSDGALGDHSS
jgi:hypothetical protein